MENTTENNKKEDNAKIHIGVISSGHAHVDTKDISTRRMITKLFFMVSSLERDNIDINIFKKLVISSKSINTDKNLDAYEILETFFSLNENVQIEILKDCTSEIKRPELWAQEINNSYIETYEYPKGRTESELRRLIKYAKNPMEKQALQRELGELNFWNGKHSKGNKRKRK